MRGSHEPFSGNEERSEQRKRGRANKPPQPSWGLPPFNEVNREGTPDRMKMTNTTLNVIFYATPIACIVLMLIIALGSL